MENNIGKKYNVLMIIWGLALGPIEFLFINSKVFENINIPFIKAPYINYMLALAFIALCFRIITYIIQIPYKRKIENKNEIRKNRHLALICSIISIILMLLIMWSIAMNGDPDGDLFIVLFLTFGYSIVQIPFLLPIF